MLVYTVYGFARLYIIGQEPSVPYRVKPNDLPGVGGRNRATRASSEAWRVALGGRSGASRSLGCEGHGWRDVRHGLRGAA